MTRHPSIPARFAEFAWTVTQAQIDAYAAAAGANDPIHIDPAGRADSGGTIAQGMLVLAVMAEYVADSVSDRSSWHENGAIDVRFRAPARPGDRLSVQAVLMGGPSAEPDEGSVSYELWCENPAGIRIVAGKARIPLAAFNT